MSTDPISLDVALDIARHPGSFGGSMKALALDVLAGQVEQLRAERDADGCWWRDESRRLRAELVERDTTIAAAGQVLAAWDTDCPGGIHDSVYAAMDRLRAALSTPVEAPETAAGGTLPARGWPVLPAQDCGDAEARIGVQPLERAPEGNDGGTWNPGPLAALSAPVEEGAPAEPTSDTEDPT